MKNIGYSDFIRICQIDGCLDTWCDWLSIRPDGVYIKVPSTEIWLMPEERAELTRYHPTGNLSEPALSFPCDFVSLILFLEQQAIGIEIDAAYVKHLHGGAELTVKPKSARQAQDEVILFKLCEMGVNPTRLPKREPGKRGVKAAVWSAVKSDTQNFRTRKVFDIAWQRMRDCGDIAD